ncbi:MAG: rod shape-determining protein MreC, partial [bacterium]|nr:rod shape-determining protein MreC [bacterium]
FTLAGSTLLAALSPVWKAENRFAKGFSTAFLWVHSKEALIARNQELAENLESLETELVFLRSARERELALLELLGRVESRGSILASVLIRPPETPYDILIIDAGERHGVKKGSRVSMPEGPALGEITEVESRTSRVRLYSSSGEKVNAYLERNNMPVILQGSGGGNFRLILPRDVAIEVGDRILAAEVTSELLAVVGDINMSATDSFKEVIAISVANIFTQRYVLVSP